MAGLQQDGTHVSTHHPVNIKFCLVCPTQKQSSLLHHHSTESCPGTVRLRLALSGVPHLLSWVSFAVCFFYLTAVYDIVFADCLWYPKSVGAL